MYRSNRPFNYAISATMSRGDDLEWVTRYFLLAEVAVPNDGSRVHIRCHDHEEFHFFVDDNHVWSGIIPFLLVQTEALVRAKQLPPSALSEAKEQFPAIKTKNIAQGIRRQNLSLIGTGNYCPECGGLCGNSNHDRQKW